MIDAPQQMIAPHVVAPPTALQWFQEFNVFWVAGVLPIILAYIGYRSLKTKVDAINRERQNSSASNEDDGDIGEETILRYMAKRMRKAE